jgi:hypothetical protein
MAKGDLMVEYGPVEIGGKTYICPVKSVAIARGYEPALSQSSSDPLLVFHDQASQSDPTGSSDEAEILQTMLNHVVFKQYHLFRSELRILTGDDAGRDASPPGSVPATAPSGGSIH